MISIRPTLPSNGMADGQNVSSLPLPPMQYISMYTDENVKRGKTQKPPPPIKDRYAMFGKPFSTEEQIIVPLENQGLRRLHPHHYDHKRELKKLNHSILVNFLDLLDVMIQCPDSAKRTEKIEDLQLLFFHMHHLINEFRPHQARETLRVLLEVQKKQRLETAERFRHHLETVQEKLRNTLSTLPESHDLDSKLLVKTENMEVDGVPIENGHVGTNSQVRVKLEPEDEEPPQINMADRMMCDIIDALN